MKKYEVLAMVWDREQKKSIKAVIGTFDKYINAKIFANAYHAEFSSNTEINEHE